jgi:hypothetical protein
MKHSAVTPPSVHPAWFYQENDPGAVGAGKAWVKPNSIAAPTSYQFRQRNPADDGWLVLLDTANMGGGTVLEVNFSVTGDRLATLHETPVTIVAAPGPGKIVAPIGGTCWIEGSAMSASWGNLYLGCPAQNFYQILITAADSELTKKRWVGLRADYSGFLVDAENQPLLLRVQSPGSSAQRSPLESIAVHTGGSGYAPGDTGNVDYQYGTYEILTVDGSGSVLTISLTDPGIGSNYPYSGFIDVSTQLTSGGGDGMLTLDITLEVGPDVHGRILYWILDA